MKKRFWQIVGFPLVAPIFLALGILWIFFNVLSAWGLMNDDETESDLYGDTW